MSRHLPYRKGSQPCSTLRRQAGVLLAILAILISSFTMPMASKSAMARALDIERIQVAALFGSDAFCEPTQHQGDKTTPSHAHHCVLCSSLRFALPDISPILIGFEGLEIASLPQARHLAMVREPDIASRPHKPRDPPSLA
ncbi:hypothetical protein ACFSM5_19090 [Lacibacterium aquatile]|uniref:DUF2946 domain-containing protein n=1 Tax=Lacibacterium aquatile TaxID=1168082 RepID=A0ABW5DV58_9PROT